MSQQIHILMKNTSNQSRTISKHTNARKLSTALESAGLDVCCHDCEYTVFRGLHLFSKRLKTLTLRTLMSSTVDIPYFYLHLYSQLLKVKYGFNFETLIYLGTSQITQIFSHLKLWIAVARHNLK